MTTASTPAVGGSPFLMLDCDLTGHKSVIDLVKAGTVDARPIRSFDEADALYWALYYGKIPMPTVLLIDTITGLISMTRQDVVLPPELKGQQTLTQLGDKIVTSKREYGIVGDKITRFYRNCRELPCKIVLIAHESQREDLMSNTEKMTISAQKMILTDITVTADAIIRLTTTTVPMSYNGVDYPAGTRQLLLAPTADSAIGIRTHLALPPFIMRPTLSDLITVLGGWEYFPDTTVLYGPPKVGKTTLITGAVR
jgi:hypothetical protein